MVTNNFSPEAIKLANDLLTKFFQMNLDCDNIAYALDTYLNCPKASEIYHQKFAHLWPSDEFADNWSAILVDEGVKPHRGPLTTEDREFDNIVTAFEDNYRNTERLKADILSAIEFYDYDKEYKVLVIELEEMSRKVSKLVHQCDIWRTKAKEYFNDGKTYKFDIDFEEFTII